MTEKRIGVTAGPAKREHYRFEEHDGRTILIADYRDTDRELLLERVRVVSDFIMSQPFDSVLQITIVNDDPYPTVWMRAIIEAVRVHKPHMRASAVVGLRRLKPVVNAVNRLAGRNIRVFDDTASAILWLLAEAGERA